MAPSDAVTRGRSMLLVRHSRNGVERMLAAAWFAAWGMLAAGAMYLAPATQSGWAAVTVWVVVPGIAAAAVGAGLGPLFLRRATAGPWKSLALGAVAATLTHVVFAPAFGLGWWLMGSGTTNLPGMIFATLTLGFVMVAPVTLPTGMVAGWLLYWLGRTRR